MRNDSPRIRVCSALTVQCLNESRDLDLQVVNPGLQLPGGILM